ncbi:MAG: hypothetical protein ABSD46_11370 [Bacteroidota bacterium]|jgi:hypothetical protein
MISQDIFLAQFDFLSDTNNHLHFKDSLMLFGLRGSRIQQNKCGAFKKHSAWNLIPSRPIKMKTPGQTGVLFAYTADMLLAKA